MSVPVKSSVVFSSTAGTFQFLASEIQGVYLGVSDATVHLNLNNSNTDARFNYIAVDTASAYRILQQVRDVISGKVTGTVPIIDTVQPYIISTVTPSPFDITTSRITISGSGFYPTILPSYIWIEDNPGSGLDSNGYHMTVTVISPTQMIADFASPGDGILGPGAVYIYYQDSTGFQSNVLIGTNPAGTTITIP